MSNLQFNIPIFFPKIRCSIVGTKIMEANQALQLFFDHASIVSQFLTEVFNLSVLSELQNQCEPCRPLKAARLHVASVPVKLSEELRLETELTIFKSKLKTCLSLLLVNFLFYWFSLIFCCLLHNSLVNNSVAKSKAQ